MAGNRTLKLSILGDVDSLNKSLKNASKDVDTFGDKMGKAGKVVGAAFAAAAAAAGAYAIKIGIEGVKAAIADEKAQTLLAVALENATGATKDQIQATEDSILKMSLATGVADDELRPALGRLVRSTGDTQKAQELLAQALDISTATGKPLETVAAALSKGFDGNTTALGKLGIGLSTAELKTMSFEQVQGKLSDLFGGAAAKNAETYSGRIARMQIAFDEAKETLGFALLPIIQKFIDLVNKYALPVINSFAKAFSNEPGGAGAIFTTLGTIITSVFKPIIEGLVTAFGFVKDAIGDNLETFKTFGTYIGTYLAPIIGTVLGGALSIAGGIAGGVINIIGGVVGVLNGLIAGAVTGINALIGAYNAIPFLPNVSKITVPKVNVPTITPPKVGTATPSIPKMPAMPSGSSSSGGGVSSAAKSASTAAASSSKVSSGTFIKDSMKDYLDANTGAPIVNLTVTGAFDKEGTARTIVETLNSSFYRGTGGATAFAIA